MDGRADGPTSEPAAGVDVTSAPCVCVYSREPDKPSVSPCQTSLAPAACFDFFAGGLDLISTSAPFLKTAEMAPLCAAHTLDRTS